jgi:hypothetical protein
MIADQMSNGFVGLQNRRWGGGCQRWVLRTGRVAVERRVVSAYERLAAASITARASASASWTARTWFVPA